MGLQIIGNTGVVMEVESNTRAARSVLRPIDFGSLGIYSYGHSSGIMAAGLAAAGEIFQFRWTDATRVALIKMIKFSAACDTTAFTAGSALFDLIPSRTWTASGTGGTAATLTGNNSKLRASMGTMLAGDIRGSSTAALGAGTKTLDNNAIAAIAAGVPAVAGQQLVAPYDLFNPETESEYPLVLAQNEGFSIRATVPATGTWKFTVSVKWAELASY